MLLSDFTKGTEKWAKIGTFLHFWIPYPYLIALKTFLAASLVPCGKKLTLFIKFGACIQSQERF